MFSANIVNTFITAACSPIGPNGGSHQNGMLEEANELLKAYPALSSADIYTSSVLGESKQVSDFLTADPSLATKKGGSHNWDALTYLCFSRYLRLDKERSEDFQQTVKVLLDRGANANTGFFENEHEPNPEWESVLYGAAGVAQHAGVTKLLIAHGADPNDGEVAYHSPETYDNSALQELINSEKLSQDTLATMLLRKADFHDYNGMKLLLDAGADPNYITVWGYTALQQTVRRDNDLRNIELMIEYGGDALTPSKADGHSATVVAICRGRADVLSSFIAKGIKIEPEGIEKLLFACVMNDTETVKSMAAQQPELVLVIHKYGGKLLSEFAGTANAAGVAQLLDLGVPVTAIYEGDGYFGIAGNSTALHVAAWRAWPNVVQLLIERGAPVNIKDGIGRTPLMLAVYACVNSYWSYRRNTASIELLLKAGASKDGIAIPTGYDEADQLLAEK
jgi:ankyrin repeat protein